MQHASDLRNSLVRLFSLLIAELLLAGVGGFEPQYVFWLVANYLTYWVLITPTPLEYFHTLVGWEGFEPPPSHPHNERSTIPAFQLV